MAFEFYSGDEATRQLRTSSYNVDGGRPHNFDFAFNYWAPDLEEMLNTPYIVVKNGWYDEQGRQLLNGYNEEFGLTEAIGHLKDLFTKIIAAEHTKEQTYLLGYSQHLIDSGLVLNPNSHISNFINDPTSYEGQFSKVWNEIEQITSSLNEFTVGLDGLTDAWNEYEEYFSSKAFVPFFKNATAPENLDIANMTAEQVVDSVQEQIIQQFPGDHGVENYRQYVKKVFDNIKQQLFSPTEKLADIKNSALKDIGKNAEIKTKIKNYQSGNKTENLYTILMNRIYGFLNGLPEETFVADVRGATTGRIKGVKGKQIQTDVLKVVDFDFQVKSLQDNEFFKKVGTTLKELNAFLKQFSTNNFIVHYSAKGRYTENKTIKLHGEATLSERAEPLYQIANELSDSNYKKSIYQLIFAIANSGKDLIAEDRRQDIIQGITTLVAAYFFEDYAETFEQVEPDLSGQTSTNNKLHIYYLHGKYYTVSDILSIALRHLNGLNRSSTSSSIGGIRVALNSPTISPYDPSSLKGLTGQSRWDKVREIAFSNTKIGFYININTFLKEIYDVV